MPIITIGIMFLKSLYTNQIKDLISLIACLIGIVTLMTSMWEMAAILIGLLTCLDLYLWIRNEQCGEFTIDDSKINDFGFSLLFIINVIIVLMGMSFLAVNPGYSIVNQIHIDEKGIEYDLKPKLIEEDMATRQIDYQRKYRYAKTIYCEDTDIDCLNYKIKIAQELGL